MLLRYAMAFTALLFCLNRGFAADLTTVSDISTPQAPTLTAAAPIRPSCGSLPTQQCDPSIARGRVAGWPQVWGYVETVGIFGGERMAPNGVLFDPLFVTNINLNIGLLPNKALYVFTDSKFWMQEPGQGCSTLFTASS
jgi:hypothetical protein